MSEEEPITRSIVNTNEPASVRKTTFCCPHCGAFTTQYWYTLYAEKNENKALPYVPDSNTERATLEHAKDMDREHPESEIFMMFQERFRRFRLKEVFFDRLSDSIYKPFYAYNLNLSQCFACDGISIWLHERLLHPVNKAGPQPHQDLPDHIRPDFEEARAILDQSPRGAVALLRLAVEKLCDHLGAKGSSIDKKIGDLVSRGLNPRVQQALDSVRVIGSQAVHPGELNLKDDRDTGEKLLRIINMIVERMIKDEREAEELYSSLPQTKLDAIERRDKDKTGN